jgi:hypothetical protein
VPINLSSTNSGQQGRHRQYENPVLRIAAQSIFQDGMGIVCKQVACNREALHGLSGAFRVMPAAMTRYVLSSGEPDN